MDTSIKPENVLENEYYFIILGLLCLFLTGCGVGNAAVMGDEYVDFISGNVTYVSSPQYVSLPHADLPLMSVTNPLTDESGISPGVVVYGRLPQNGLNILTLDNSGEMQDMVFALQKPNWPSPDFAILIPGGAVVTIKQIPDGSYDGYLVSGSEWNSKEKRFINDPHYYQISVPVSLQTSSEQTENGNQLTYKRIYTVYSFLLQKIMGDPTIMNSINPEDYPELKIL